VAVEPVGPPFADTPFGRLAHGLTAAPMEPRNLAGIPIALVTGEASPFAAFAGEIVAFLSDAGCAAERLHLPDHGVRGNGHGIMLERNNREALGAILAWLEANVADFPPPTEEQ
jgi:hypothetical protein